MMIKSEVQLIITLAVQRKIGQVGKASWIWSVDDLAATAFQCYFFKTF